MRNIELEIAHPPGEEENSKEVTIVEGHLEFRGMTTPR